MHATLVGGPVVVYKTDVAAKTTTENEIHKEKREIPVTLQNSRGAEMAPGQHAGKQTPAPFVTRHTRKKA